MSVRASRVWEAYYKMYAEETESSFNTEACEVPPQT